MGSKFYKQIADASANGGGVYVQDGVYKFMIEKMFEHESDQPGGGTSFICELRVLESTPHPSYPDVKPNAVGTTCSVVANVSKHASAFGNIKALLLGALGAFGYTEDQITPEVIENAYNSEDLRGIILEDTTYRKKTKGGIMITLHKWSSVEQTEEDVKRQAAELTAGKYNAKSPATGAGSGSKSSGTTETAPKKSLLARQ